MSGLPPYPYALRAPTEDDVGFVKSTWLSSYHDRALGSLAVSALTWARYKTLMRPLCSALLERGVLVVACDPDMPAVLYGWALGEGGEVPVLHYAYVRPERRRYGLYRELHSRISEQTGRLIEASHMTEAGRWIIKSKGLQYNPLTARLAA